MHIAHLARAENELLASPLEDKLRFVFREDVRGAIVLLRQLLLPLHHFARKANDHVVLIGLSVNRDGSECRAFDLHSLTLVLFPILRDTLNGMSSGVGCDIGDLPIGAHAFRMQLSDCDALDFAAAEGPPRKLQAFRLKPSPAFGWLLLQFSFLLHGRSAKKLGSVTSSHAPKRRLNVRFMSERHPLHL